MTRHLMDNDRRRLLLALAGTGALAGVSALLPGYARGTPLTPRAGNAAQVNGGVPGPVLLDFDVRRERVAIAGGHFARVVPTGITATPACRSRKG